MSYVQLQTVRLRLIMSHSLRRRPYAPYIAGRRTQKKDKVRNNRMTRRRNRLLVTCDTPVFFNKHELWNEWSWKYDGTRHWAPYNPRGWMTYQEWFNWAKRK